MNFLWHFSSAAYSLLYRRQSADSRAASPAGRFKNGSSRGKALDCGIVLRTKAGRRSQHPEDDEKAGGRCRFRRADGRDGDGSEGVLWLASQDGWAQPRCNHGGSRRLGSGYGHVRCSDIDGDFAVLCFRDQLEHQGGSNC